jgi:hypothetical protein
MDREDRPASGGAFASQLIDISRIRDRFEKASRSGRRPAIEECLVKTAREKHP